MAATYRVLIDWDGNDLIAEDDADEDVTEKVKSVNISYGRTERFGEPQIGVCEITLVDTDGTYSPKNTGGALYGNLKAGRKVHVYGTINGSKYNLFFGYVDEIIPRAEKWSQEALIRCVDGMERIERAEISFGVVADQGADDFIGLALDEAGWSATARDLEDFEAETIPYSWVYEQSALAAIREAMHDTLGLFYINQGGTAVYESRHHRFTSAKANPIGTLNANEKPISVDYQYSPRYVVNIAEADFTPFEVETIVDVLWELEEPLFMTDGTPYAYGTTNATLWIETEFSGPAATANALAGTVDYLVFTNYLGDATNLTSQVDITIEEHRGEGALLKVVNNSGTSGYITYLQVQGTVLITHETVKKATQDQASIDDYGPRYMEIGPRFMPSPLAAQDLADYLVDEYADVKEDIGVELLNANDDIWERILQTSISDRLHVEYSPIGLDEDFFVEGITHEISEAFKLHRCKLLVSPVSAYSYWILGVSQLDVDTRLAP